MPVLSGPSPPPPGSTGSSPTPLRAAHAQALREILYLLGPSPGKSSGPPPAALDGAPQPDLRDPIQVYQRIMSILGRTGEWTHAALVWAGDEEHGLHLVAASDEIEPPGPFGPCDHLADALRRPLPEGPYAGLRAALRSGGPALIQDPDELARLSSLSPETGPGPGGVLVLPLLDDLGDRCGEGAGLLMLLYGGRDRLDEPTREFLYLAAHVAALGLRGPRAVDTLRDNTRRVNLHRYAAERRREAVLQYREFFESSADGVLVLEGGGKVIYLNRTAEQMTGYSATGLSGREVSAVVPPSQMEGLLDAVQQVLLQVALLPFDLQLFTTSGETLVVSVSSSSVLADHGLAVLLFRDVTEQRILEHELRKTKEFLERLIDSTVDGIIAADLHGNVILFNQGASRITGYQPEEVIGKLPVWCLYPEGDARVIMSQLRAAGNRGAGRLSQSRRTVVGKDGSHIPVYLTASIVYEQGREVATVGILADLRERLNIEQRLQRAQEMLAVSEKQALIAELAGTAAHELNQPLTSVMGYAGLLRRKFSSGNAEALEFVDIIVREAERMAEIVRKIGRITRYETKPYVGEARIIDLEKSAGGDEADPARPADPGTAGGRDEP